MKCPKCLGNCIAPENCNKCSYFTDSLRCICSECKGTGQYNDPYLVPGQVCEVWDYGSTVKRLRYFDHIGPGYGNTSALYFRDSHDYGENKIFVNYRPINTEWDFAPPWAKCIVITHDGLNVFFSIIEIEPYFTSWAPKKGHERDRYSTMVCGICHDKSRYENDAWKTSLRKRQFWAEVKDETRDDFDYTGYIKSHKSFYNKQSKPFKL